MSRSRVGAHKMEVSLPGVFSARFLLLKIEGCMTTLLWQAQCASKCKKLRCRVTSTCHCLEIHSTLKAAQAEGRWREKRSGIGPHQEYPLLGLL